MVDKPGWWIFLLGVPRQKYAPPGFIHRPRVAYRSNGRLVVVDISRSRKGFRPMQPVEPPPKHLLAKLAYSPKLGCGAPKMLSTPVAPPSKRHRKPE